MHDLTKGQRRALRDAAALAHERDSSMSREDRDVHYLEARNYDLPIIVGRAVVEGLLTLDEIGDAARDLAADFANRLRSVYSAVNDDDDSEAEGAQADAEPAEDAAYDPNAVVSVSKIVFEMDAMDQESSLFVNRVTGEVAVLRSGDDWVDVEEDPNEDEDGEPLSLDEHPDWTLILSGYDLDDYGMMKRFATRAVGPAASKALLQTLQGRGAYRAFRDEIRHRGLSEDWDRYQNERRTKQVCSHLQENGIAFRK